jgi:L-alanine-DL-glutamate epimerase-like enolase superfamily enzyme
LLAPDGYIYFPDTPGIGVETDWAVLASLRIDMETLEHQ